MAKEREVDEEDAEGRSPMEEMASFFCFNSRDGKLLFVESATEETLWTGRMALVECGNSGREMRVGGSQIR